MTDKTFTVSLIESMVVNPDAIRSKKRIHCDDYTRTGGGVYTLKDVEGAGDIEVPMQNVAGIVHNEDA